MTWLGIIKIWKFECPIHAELFSVSAISPFYVQYNMWYVVVELQQYSFPYKWMTSQAANYLIKQSAYNL